MEIEGYTKIAMHILCQKKPAETLVHHYSEVMSIISA